MIDWLRASKLSPRRVFVTHGEPSAPDAMRRRLVEAFGWNADGAGARRGGRPGAAMNGCACTEPHEPRRIVLTGGPGAGKTAVLELMRKTLCKHVKVLAGGGRDRVRRRVPARRRRRRCGARVSARSSTSSASSRRRRAPRTSRSSLCDRGTVDGLAYWPGPDDLWPAVGTSLDGAARALSRGDPPPDAAERGVQPSESAARRDRGRGRRDRRAHRGGVGRAIPRRFEVRRREDFLAKAARVIELVRDELPACCRRHPVAELGGGAAAPVPPAPVPPAPVPPAPR